MSNRKPAGRGRGKNGWAAGPGRLTEQMNKLTVVEQPGAGPKAMSSILPPKSAPGTKGRPMDLDTNMYEINLPEETPLYRYDVSIKAVKGRGRPREMAGGGKNDYFYNSRRDICLQVFYNLMEQNEREFGNYFAYQYDMAKMLYSLYELDNLQNPYRVEMSNADQCNLLVSDNVTHFEVCITPVVSDFSIVLGDFKAAIDRDLTQRDRSSIQHLEVTTSQVIQNNMMEKKLPDGQIVYNRAYWSYRTAHFRKDATQMDRKMGQDRCMIKGFTKTVRMIKGEGEGEQARPVMMLDVKTDVCWVEQHVLQLASTHFKVDLSRPCNFGYKFEEWERDRLNDILKNLVVKPTYGRRCQPITVSGLTHLHQGGAHDKKFTNDQGVEISVAQYIHERYGETVRFPNLPLVKEFRQKDKGYNYYPLEFCVLLAGQRVEQSKQTPAQMSAVVPKSALKPADRWPQIENLAQKAGVFDNEYIKEIGISFSRRLSVKGRELQPPVIQCSFHSGPKKDIQVTNLRSDWSLPNGAKFAIAGQIRKWAVMGVKDQDGNLPCSQQDFMAFIQKYIAEAKKRGLILPEPAKHGCVMPEGTDKFGDECKQDGVAFVLFISQSRNPQMEAMHDRVKQYFEEDLNILTQQLVYDRTIKPILNGDKFWEKKMQNILQKTNIKASGLNYEIKVPDILKNDFMIVSYDVCHPTNLKPHMMNEDIPSTVGLCTNSGRHCLQLTGNYGYQAMRKEECGTILKHLMLGQLRIWLRNHHGKPPKYVLVLRDGISEGQYDKVIMLEMPMLLSAFEELELPLPKLEVYTIEKRHNARFRPLRMPGNNVNPGTVAELGANHNEFYMCTHRAIQGTAKLPRYGQLVSEIGLSMDDIQGIIFALACNHQIITTPVSLPATLYGAHELAKRGKNSRKARIGREESSSGVSTDSGVLSANGEGDMVGMNYRLGILGSLKDVKYWA